MLTWNICDETRVLTTANNMNDLQIKLNSTLNCMSAGFSVKGLSLNIEKKKITFSSNHFQNYLFQITYQYKKYKRSYKH